MSYFGIFPNSVFFSKIMKGGVKFLFLVFFLSIKC